MVYHSTLASHRFYLADAQPRHSSLATTGVFLDRHTGAELNGTLGKGENNERARCEANMNRGPFVICLMPVSSNDYLIYASVHSPLDLDLALPLSGHY
jgi:hypothetical protein